MHMLAPRAIVPKLREFARRAEGAALAMQPAQGRVSRCLSTDRHATHSHYQTTGLGLSFAAWRFVHQARLDVLPVNVAASRSFPGRRVTACRVCRVEAETVCHVMAHCRPMLSAIAMRHHTVLGRLVAALSPAASASLSLGCVVPALSGQTLKPDLVLDDGSEAVLVDVTCPFEGSADALDVAASLKKQKYATCISALLAAGRRSAVVRPFVVGSLGGWWPGNEACLADLGIPRSSRTLLRRLCVSDAIMGSAAVWTLFRNREVGVIPADRTEESSHG